MLRATYLRLHIFWPYDTLFQFHLMIANLRLNSCFEVLIVLVITKPRVFLQRDLLKNHLKHFLLTLSNLFLSSEFLVCFMHGFPSLQFCNRYFNCYKLQKFEFFLVVFYQMKSWLFYVSLLESVDHILLQIMTQNFIELFNFQLL